ncbi:MAG: sugar kinase [Candidatus Marinimicrobia bacterium]|nr:sugar kinase [Candidatus Neomarinimicrobiota bacterium]
MSQKIVTFGEIMLRLAPYDYLRLAQADRYQATFGGGEANVAVSLAMFGNDVQYVTRLPDNPVADAALASVHKYGVGTDFVARGGDRMGIYFLEHGASVRPSKVTYDRANTAISQVSLQDFDWTAIFADVKWFHTTGITPALSPETAAVTLQAAKAAKAAGVMVSCDLNYRNKLWTREEAKKVMTELVQFTDVIIANEEDCADVFGIRASSTDVHKGELDVDHYREVAQEVMKISKAKLVAITLRESLSASDNNWAAMLYDGTNFFLSKKYTLHIVDRVGGGDSFGAGLIHSLVNGKAPQEALEFAVAASAMKHTIPGDFNLVTEAEVNSVAGGNTSGRVQR